MMKEITVLIQIVTNQIITTKKSKRKIKMINIRRTIDLSGQHQRVVLKQLSMKKLIQLLIGVSLNKLYRSYSNLKHLVLLVKSKKLIQLFSIHNLFLKPHLRMLLNKNSKVKISLMNVLMKLLKLKHEQKDMSLKQIRQLL